LAAIILRYRYSCKQLTPICHDLPPPTKKVAGYGPVRKLSVVQKLVQKQEKVVP